MRLTDLALLFPDSPIVRNANVGKTVADGLMIRGGKKCYIEIDNTGKMTVKKQMQAKWERYSGVDGFILVIALTEGRMERLRKGAELVKNVALFTTFERLQSDQPKPWVDWFGKIARI